MLKDLETYFTKMGWYAGTHDFITIRLEGGFEAFSGRASETWEYRWVIMTHQHTKLGIPEMIVQGKRGESLDDLAAKVLKQLKK